MIDHGEYWSPNATVTLYRVPWDSGYSDVVDWKSEAHRNAWFNAQSDKYEFANDSAYHRTGSQLRVDMPYPEAYGWNYVHVHNGDIADTSKVPTDFYYFIQNATMTNPAVTKFDLMLDVWTTYEPTTSLVGGYVTRSHLPMVDLDANSDDNVPIALNTYFSQSEGLNVGTEFQTYAIDQTRFDDARDFGDSYSPSFNDSHYFAVITSTADLTANMGSISNPNLKTATGTQGEGLVGGSSTYVMRIEDFLTFMRDMSGYSWVSQCITGITIVPAGFIDLRFSVTGETAAIANSDVRCAYIGALDGAPRQVGSISMSKISDEGWNARTEKYKDLRKLWAYPYSCVTLDNFEGSVLALKPQLLADDETALDVMSTALPPFTRAAVFPWGYGGNSPDVTTVQKPSGYGVDASGKDDSLSYDMPMGDVLQSALWYSDFPQVSLVNNNYITYMASNANRIQWRYDSAQWAYTAAMNSANAGLGIAATNQAASTTAYDNAIRNQRLANSAKGTGIALGTLGDVGQTLLSGITGAAAGAAGGAPGIVAGAVTGLAPGAISTITGTSSSVNSLEIARQQTENNTDTYNALLSAMGTNALLSYDNAQKNALGNRDNAIAGTQAAVADAALTPPSTVGQMGGNGFMFSWGLLFCMWTRYMRVSDDAIIRAGQYFRRFGYAVNRYMRFPTSQLNVCRYFSYYKVMDMNIPKSRADEATRGVIRDIFERGVTVWSDPAQIGSVDTADNVPNHDMDGRYYG